MLKKWLPVVCLLLGVQAAYGAAGADEYEKIDLVVSKGDPQAGRQAFLDLGCPSCHYVEGLAGDQKLPAPKVTTPVPTLGPRQAKMSPGKLASAMIAPSHLVSEVVKVGMEGELSPMPDLTETMTVRQMADLVAFVRSLDRRKGR